jgi:hypothetical protein
MSKELEALKRITKAFHTALICAGVEQEDIETEKALTLVEKSLKALKIIKEKMVDIGWIIRSENHSKYNLGVGKNQSLKKGQYDLLKEVLL